jgi:CAAX prenyl protease-like protein
MTKSLVIAPYATWMALMFIRPAGSAWSYAGRTVVTAAVFLFFALSSQAFRNFKLPRLSEFFFGAAVGVLVLLLWVYPENFEWYKKYCIIGYRPDAFSPANVYDPSQCGWGLTAMRLIGSAFIIAPAEELFFRHFLYRWLQKKDWVSVSHQCFDVSAFVWSVGLFALEHDRIVAAILAGALYTLLYMHKGLWAAVIAHTVTNFLLGIYVIYTSNWAFW